MKKILAGLFVVFMGALFGCGSSGSGSSNSGTSGSNVAATNTKFAPAMISGNTYAFDLIRSNGNHINPETIIFNSDGTGTSAGADNGAVSWSIDSSGRLIIVNPITGLTISAAITDASNLSVIKTNLYEFNTSKTIDTVVTATMTLTNSGTSTTTSNSVFTSAMLAGKTATVTRSSDTNVFTFAATGNVVTVATTNGPLAGTFTINSNGTLTLAFPTDTITYTITNQNGNILTVTDFHASSPSVTEGPETMKIN